MVLSSVHFGEKSQSHGISDLLGLAGEPWDEKHLGAAAPLKDPPPRLLKELGLYHLLSNHMQLHVYIQQVLERYFVQCFFIMSERRKISIPC